jgi:hypothetical protein
MSVAGPHFMYEEAPHLFLGRRGMGPLEVVWDTNVLLDYLEHGGALWEGVLQLDDEDYAAELEALGLIINLWMRRDIRFRVLLRSIHDAKRTLSTQRQHLRARAIDELAAALTLDAWPELGAPRETEQAAHIALPRSAAERLLERLPSGADRDLVIEALGLGAHVFLTRDRGLLTRASDLQRLGLLIASPLDLLEQLAECGALLAVLRPETVYWPLPDLQRTSHLIQALPSDR